MAKNNSARLSLSVAFCGIVSAFAVVMMFGSLIPSFAYAVPAFAGILIYFVGEQLGRKWAYLSYLTVALLSFILIPELEADFFFLSFFGYYPTLRTALSRIKNRVLRYIVKLLIFNAAVVLTYQVLCALLSVDQMLEGLEDFGVYAVYILWGSGNLAFVLYDFFLDTVARIYRNFLKPKLDRLTRGR
ncbi:MAG: hypothetical protein NC084_01530 [Bacteroides sp.]|nr:hypothetical protein [Eubacterium sp.]MCM1417735.1 hypothetical protein [Roseburia sp.]MCM1461374.1 hypothetical protein [Bacteroides sp.]